MATRKHTHKKKTDTEFKAFLQAKLAEARSGGFNISLQKLLTQAKNAGFYDARGRPAVVMMRRAAAKLRVVAEAALSCCSIMTLTTLEEVVRSKMESLEAAGCFSFLKLEVCCNGKRSSIQSLFRIDEGVSPLVYTVEEAYKDLAQFGKLHKNFDRAPLESFLVQEHGLTAVEHLGIFVGSVPLLASTARDLSLKLQKKAAAARSAAESAAAADVSNAFAELKRMPDMDQLFSQMLDSRRARLPEDPAERSSFCLSLFKRLQQCLHSGTVTPKMLGLRIDRSDILDATVSCCERLRIPRDCSLEELARLEEEVLQLLGEGSFERINNSRSFIEFLCMEANEVWPEEPAEEANSTAHEAVTREAETFLESKLPEWLMRDLSVNCEDGDVLLDLAIQLGHCSVGDMPEREVLAAIIADRLEAIKAAERTLRTTCISDMRPRGLDQCKRQVLEPTIQDARAAIERVPFLFDVAFTTGWPQHYENAHGPLRDFLTRHCRSMAFTASNGGIVRLDPKPSLSELRHALEQNEPMRTAVTVLSLLHKQTAPEEIAMAFQESFRARDAQASIVLSHQLLQCLPCPEHRLMVLSILSGALSARLTRADLVEALHAIERGGARGILGSMAVLDPSIATVLGQLEEELAADLESCRSAGASGPFTSPQQHSGGTVPSLPTEKQQVFTENGDSKACKSIIQAIQKKWTAGENMSEEQRAFFEHLETKLSGMIGMASEDIYGSSDRFLMELVQNADDNTYAEGVKPTLTLCVLKNGLLLHNNETGFTEQNVVSICDVQKSSKANKAGYIGEKGIGFKAVFKVSHAPEIHSNGFHFAFDTIANPRLGYVSPVWKDTPSPDAATLLGAEADGTVLYLPWRETQSAGKWSQMAKRELRTISSTVILFLGTLQEIVAYDDNQQLIRELVKTVEEDQENSSVVSVREKKRDEEQSSRWWVYEEEVTMRCSRNGQQRSRIALAFPLAEEGLLLKEGSLVDQDVCSFLPMKAFGFTFVLQADFSLVSSREAPKQDDEWNEELFARIPCVLMDAFEHLRDNVCRDADTSDSSHLVNRFLEFLSMNARAPFTAVANSMLSRFQDVRCVPTGEAGVFALPNEVLLVPKLASAYHCDLEAIAKWQGSHLLEREVCYARVLSRLGARLLDADFLVDSLRSITEDIEQEAPHVSIERLRACLRLWHAMGFSCNRLDDVPCIPIEDQSKSLCILTASEARSKRVFVRSQISKKEFKTALKGLNALTAQLCFVHPRLTASEDVRKTLESCGLTTFSVADLFDTVALPWIAPAEDYDPQTGSLVFVDAQILAVKLCKKDQGPLQRLQRCQAVKSRRGIILTRGGRLVPPCSISRKKTVYTLKSSHFLSPHYEKVAKAAGVSLQDFKDAFLVPRTFALVDTDRGSFSSPELEQFAEWCEAQSSGTLEKALQPTAVQEDWSTTYRSFQSEPILRKQLLGLRWYIYNLGSSWQAFSLQEMFEPSAVETELGIESRSTVERLFPCRDRVILPSLLATPNRLSLEFLLDLVTNRWAASGAVDSSLWNEEPNSMSAGVAPLAAAVYIRILELVEKDASHQSAELVRKRMSGKSILRVATKGASVSFVEPSTAFIADPIRLIEGLGSGSMVLLRYYTAAIAGSDSRVARLMEFFHTVLGVRSQPSIEEYVELIMGTVDGDDYSKHLLSFLDSLSALNIGTADRLALGRLLLPCHNGDKRPPQECCWAAWPHPACNWRECPIGVIDFGRELTLSQENALTAALGIPRIESRISLDVHQDIMALGLLPQRAMAILLPLMQRYLCQNTDSPRFNLLNTDVMSALEEGVDVFVLGDKDTRMRVQVECQGQLSPTFECKALFKPSGVSAAEGGKLYTCSYYVELRYEFEPMIAAFLRAFGVLEEKEVSGCAEAMGKVAKEIGIHLGEPNNVEDSVSHLQLPHFPPAEQWSLGTNDELVTVREREPDAPATPVTSPAVVSEESQREAEALFDSLTSGGEELIKKFMSTPKSDQQPSALPGRGQSFAPPGERQPSEVPVSAGQGNREWTYTEPSPGHEGTANGLGSSQTSGIAPLHDGASAGPSPAGGTFYAPGDLPIEVDASMVTFQSFSPSSESLQARVSLVSGAPAEEIDALVGRIGEEVGRLWLLENGYTQVEWVNEENESGKPFDLQCFSPDGEALLVEVKSTRCRAHDSRARTFEVSANEAALVHEDCYALLRVCDVLSLTRQVCLERTKRALASGRMQLMGLLNQA